MNESQLSTDTLLSGVVRHQRFMGHGSGLQNAFSLLRKGEKGGFTMWVEPDLFIDVRQVSGSCNLSLTRGADEILLSLGSEPSSARPGPLFRPLTIEDAEFVLQLALGLVCGFGNSEEHKTSRLEYRCLEFDGVSFKRQCRQDLWTNLIGRLPLFSPLVPMWRADSELEEFVATVTKKALAWGVDDPGEGIPAASASGINLQFYPDDSRTGVYVKVEFESDGSFLIDISDYMQPGKEKFIIKTVSGYEGIVWAISDYIRRYDFQWKSLRVSFSQRQLL